MEKSIFGSTCSLGGLLNDALLSEGEADQLLQELGEPAAKHQDVFPPVCSDSGGSVLESVIPGFSPDNISDSLDSCLPTTEPFAAALPTLPTANAQAWPSSLPLTEQPAVLNPQQNPAPNSAITIGSLAVLSQILSFLQPAAGNSSTVKPPPAKDGVSSTLVSEQPAAFRPTPPPMQQFAPVSQVVPAPAVASSLGPASTPTIPNLNAEQHQALQTFMALGQYGTTPEGKKVRRMLSNRESARRSRHRKQAHVQDLEERAARLEVENASMKEALNKATNVNLQTVEERARLYSEVATLREKVARLEAIGKGKMESLSKRGTSHSSAGGISEDSSCDSMPVKRSSEPTDERCCKRCKSCMEGVSGPQK